MNQNPDQIREQAEEAHHRLAEDLNALQYRVKEVTDWRWQFRQHPWPVLAAVFGVALLAGFLTALPRFRG
jgi:ElaB/YqjD/DUF883 family membrane-anchored ribosome-binding protein